MAKTLMVQCKKCKDWFQSPLQIDEESFKTMTLTNNSLQCPHCGNDNMTDKKDMKFI